MFAVFSGAPADSLCLHYVICKYPKSMVEYWYNFHSPNSPTQQQSLWADYDVALFTEDLLLKFVHNLVLIIANAHFNVIVHELTWI